MTRLHQHRGKGQACNCMHKSDLCGKETNYWYLNQLTLRVGHYRVELVRRWTRTKRLTLDYTPGCSL